VGGEQRASGAASLPSGERPPSQGAYYVLDKTRAKPVRIRRIYIFEGDVSPTTEIEIDAPLHHAESGEQSAGGQKGLQHIGTQKGV
jgi:hypothetical protein